MPQFRKLPAVITALRYEGMAAPRRQREMAELLDGCFGWRVVADGIEIPTANGPAIARTGDWVCRQVVNGKVDVWPCSNDIFSATYQSAEETPARLSDDEVRVINRAASYLGGVLAQSREECAALSARLFEIAGNPMPVEV